LAKVDVYFAAWQKKSVYENILGMSGFKSLFICRKANNRISKRENQYFIVPKNIDSFPHPYKISRQFSFIHSLNSLALEIPHPCGISNNLLWGGYGQFFNCLNNQM